jgi:hypothetical protein
VYSVTTPPGTKILIKSPHVRNGKLLLSEENAEVIGGQVHELYTSWKANKVEKNSFLCLKEFSSYYHC